MFPAGPCSKVEMIFKFKVAVPDFVQEKSKTKQKTRQFEKMSV